MIDANLRPFRWVVGLVLVTVLAGCTKGGNESIDDLGFRTGPCQSNQMGVPVPGEHGGKALRSDCSESVVLTTAHAARQDMGAGPLTIRTATRGDQGVHGNICNDPSWFFNGKQWELSKTNCTAAHDTWQGGPLQPVNRNLYTYGTPDVDVLGNVEDALTGLGPCQFAGASLVERRNADGSSTLMSQWFGVSAVCEGQANSTVRLPQGMTVVVFNVANFGAGESDKGDANGGGGRARGKATNDESSRIPRRAYEVLEYIREKGGPPPGYKGGKPYGNTTGLLPVEGRYLEYDIDRKVPGTPRGSERIVVDEVSGQAWYTPDHYNTFILMTEP